MSDSICLDVFGLLHRLDLEPVLVGRAHHYPVIRLVLVQLE